MKITVLKFFFFFFFLKIYKIDVLNALLLISWTFSAKKFFCRGMKRKMYTPTLGLCQCQEVCHFSSRKWSVMESPWELHKSNEQFHLWPHQYPQAPVETCPSKLEKSYWRLKKVWHKSYQNIWGLATSVLASRFGVY